MSQHDCNNDFLKALEALPDLTGEGEGEWSHRARSKWIGGVAHGRYD
jgi:hypothetical protein